MFKIIIFPTRAFILHCTQQLLMETLVFFLSLKLFGSSAFVAGRAVVFDKNIGAVATSSIAQALIEHRLYNVYRLPEYNYRL
jgi:hypothetical protein